MGSLPETKIHDNSPLVRISHIQRFSFPLRPFFFLEFLYFIFL